MAGAKTAAGVLMGAALAAAGCAVDSPEGPSSRHQEGVRIGTVTFEEPAAGLVVFKPAGGRKSNCTGALVDWQGVQFMMTASHCVQHASCTARGACADSVEFKITSSDGSQVSSYVGLRWSVHPSATLARVFDLAVVELDRAVTPDIATPFNLGAGSPPVSLLLTGYGYGPDNRKRKSDTARYDDFAVNGYFEHGDSGGPLIDAGRDVVLTVSGEEPKPILDMHTGQTLGEWSAPAFGNPTHHKVHEWIRTTLVGWHQ
jgi:hypothetical protein